jgi:WD40 repeat protein
MKRTLTRLLTLTLCPLTTLALRAQETPARAVGLAQTFSDASQISFSPAGNLIAVAGNGSVRLLDARTEKDQRTLGGAGGSNVWLEWSRDGRRLTVFKKTLKADRSVEVWNAETGELIGAVRGLPSLFRTELSLSGDRLLGVDEDNVARAWSVRDGRLIAEIRPKKKGSFFRPVYTTVAWSPDGRSLLTNDSKGVAELWDGETGKLKAQLTRRPEGYRDLTVGWEMTPNGLCHKADDQVRTVFLAGGRRLLTMTSRELPRLWDAETGQLLAVLKHPLEKDGKWPGSEDRCQNYRFGARPDWERPADDALYLTFDRGFGLWDTRTGAVIRYFPDAGEPVAFIEGGQTILTFWQPATEDLKFSQIFSNLNELRFYDAATGTLKKQFKRSPVSPSEFAFSPDGQTIINRSSTRIVLLDAASGQVKARLPTDGCDFSLLDRFLCFPLEVSAHGGFLLTQEKGRIRLWDAASGQLVEKLDAARQPASFSPDGRWLATGGKEKNAMLLWEVSGH